MAIIKFEIIKKIKLPEHEQISETYWEEDVLKFIITRNIFGTYYLNTINQDFQLKKIEESDIPKKFIKYKRTIIE